MSDLSGLLHLAGRLGATGAAVIAAADIVINDELAGRCLTPRCENYGLALSCPPHVEGPDAFRKTLEGFRQAIVLKIDVPAEILYSSESRDIFRLLHEVASGLEQEAIAGGFSRARAFAGGSCKELFCFEHRECLALTADRTCRYPRAARPSMSGFGIDVARLFATAGWEMHWVTRGSGPPATKMAGVCGLVLVR